MTIQALADKSGISTSHISAIERGKTHPTVYTLCCLAKGLNVSPFLLFFPLYGKNMNKRILQRLLNKGTKEESVMKNEDYIMKILEILWRIRSKHDLKMIYLYVKNKLEE